MHTIAKNLRIASLLRAKSMLRAKSVLRIAALAVATTSLGGCATLYDDYYGNSYYDTAYNDYSCDPYSPFDNYYDCDSRLGFYNFGYSGGWYNNLFYPGHGFYIFDRGGRRFNMDSHHRRYWGGRRHEYWQQNGRHHGQRGGRHTYGGSGRPGSYQPIAWPEQNGGRINDGEHRRRDRQHDGRHQGGHQGNGHQGGHQGNGQGYSNGGQHGDHNGGDRGYGRSGGRGDGQRDRQPAPVPQNADQQIDKAPTLRHPRNGNVNPERANSGRSEGDYGNRGRGRDFSANNMQQSAPSPQTPPEPRVQQSRPEPRPEPSAAPVRDQSNNRFSDGSNDRID